jgi:serine/alanine adding enzyme
MRMEARALVEPDELQCRVGLATAADAELWDGYVGAHPASSIYHLHAWRELIEEQFGHGGYYWVARDVVGRVRGILPLVRLRSRLFGDYQVSMPYFNYGGVLADSPQIEAQMLEQAALEGARLGVSHIEFRDTRRRELGWPVREDKVAMELKLPADPDVLWRAIGTKVRAQVKRPLREGVTVASGGEELLDDFYRVFSRNMRDLGTPVYPRRFFEAILGRFPHNCFIVSVNRAGRPAAAAFLIGWRDRLEIPWASSLREFNRLGVNMLLYWEVLRQAIERGYGRFDFGRSSSDSGTYRFKRQWGAQPVPLYWHYWLAPGRQMPNLTPANPKYRAAIRLWQSLPVPVANLLGPQLSKNLP